MDRKLCFLLIVILLAACSRAPKPEPPPKPTHVVLEIEASGDINPNAEGRSSPLVLRAYELKSATDFNGADFIALYEKDKSVLGSDLLRKQEIVLKPGEKKTVHFVVSDDGRFVGIFAAFRKYERSQWRTTVTVRQHDTMVVPITIRGNNLITP